MPATPVGFILSQFANARFASISTCLAGRYQDRLGQVSCVVCEPGLVTNANATVKCQPCAAVRSASSLQVTFSFGSCWPSGQVLNEQFCVRPVPNWPLQPNDAASLVQGTLPFLLA
jgi:hypothetical protein